MMPWGTYHFLSHKNLFSTNALPVITNRKVDVKEDCKNSIGGLDRYGNDECTSS